jgi:CheY-like chemotaxis protein
MLTLILSAGLDPQLLSTRNLALQAAGYIVVSAYSVKEAAYRFREGDFDLVLLCSSIPKDEKDRLIQWIHTSGSHIPVVSVLTESCPGNSRSCLSVDGDPAQLLEDIKQLLNAASPATAASESHGENALKMTNRKKPPESSSGTEFQSSRNQHRLVPLARTG